MNLPAQSERSLVFQKISLILKFNNNKTIFRRKNLKDNIHYLLEVDNVLVIHSEDTLRYTLRYFIVPKILIPTITT